MQKTCLKKKVQTSNIYVSYFACCCFSFGADYKMKTSATCITPLETPILSRAHIGSLYWCMFLLVVNAWSFSLYYRKSWQGGCKIRTCSLLLTTQKRKQWGGLYPADPKGRRLAPCDFVCKATQTPCAGARQRTTARTQGLSPTKGSRMAVSETLAYLSSYSLPNQYQKQQKRRREEDTQKHTQKQTNACSVGGEN